MPGTTENGRDVAWGLFLLLVGGGLGMLTGTIPDSAMVGNDDPGPRAIPIAMCGILFVGGIFSLGTALRQRIAAPAGTGRAVRFGPDEYRIVKFATTTLCYVVCVPFAFYASTFLFAGLVIWWLGAKWWSAALAATAITAVVWVLFVRMFLVPLPTLIETLTTS